MALYPAVDRQPTTPATSETRKCVISYDGVPSRSVSIMEFTGGPVAHETQDFADPFDPPRWRAALAEPMPDRSG